MFINPFAEGEHKSIRPTATALVIFGASGDLTKRKLIPALYNLAYDGYLPQPFVVIGASRTAFSHEEYRENLKQAVEKYSRRTVDPAVWEKFSNQIYYHRLDGHNVEDFKTLKMMVDKIGQESGVSLNYLYYLATAPEHFGPISNSLKQADLIAPADSHTRQTRVVVEKPFGYDLASAIELNKVVRQNFTEDQIFRIDHYLGKETVQNILVFRFSNGIFEPLWNNKFIDHIQVSVCESIGLESRAGYFDRTGIMRDIVQNHLLQVLALLCIEPPSAIFDASSIRDEKVKVLKSLKRISFNDVANQVVRGQYEAGFVNGASVPGYLEEKDVSKNSNTETYVAMKLEIDNWRWAGVPIYVRAGKRLAKRITEITIYFKQPPGSLFHGRHAVNLEQNVLAIQVQPNEGISLKINSKPPGPRMRVRPVEMDFNYGDSFGVASPDAYERLLLDAMKGDATLFTRNDEIEQAWSFLMPIFENWQQAGVKGLDGYQAGSWGPRSADRLIASSNQIWRSL